MDLISWSSSSNYWLGAWKFLCWTWIKERMNHIKTSGTKYVFTQYCLGGIVSSPTRYELLASSHKHTWRLERSIDTGCRNNLMKTYFRMVHIIVQTRVPKPTWTQRFIVCHGCCPVPSQNHNRNPVRIQSSAHRRYKFILTSHCLPKEVTSTWLPKSIEVKIYDEITRSRAFQLWIT